MLITTPQKEAPKPDSHEIFRDEGFWNVFEWQFHVDVSVSLNLSFQGQLTHRSNPLSAKFFHQSSINRPAEEAYTW